MARRAGGPQLPNGAPRPFHGLPLPSPSLPDGAPRPLSRPYSAWSPQVSGQYDTFSSAEDDEGEDWPEEVSVEAKLEEPIEGSAAAPVVLEEPKITEVRVLDPVSEEAQAGKWSHSVSINVPLGGGGGDDFVGESSRCFHRLLLEIAAEHRRALEQVKLMRMMEAEQRDGEGVGKKSSSPRRVSTAHTAHTATTMARDTLYPQHSFESLTFHPNVGNAHASPFDITSDCSSIKKTSAKPMAMSKQMRDSLVRFLGWERDLVERLSLKDLARKILTHTTLLDCISSVAIVVNSVLYGVSANESVKAAVAGRDPDGFAQSIDGLTTVFTVWFVFELVVRLCIHGAKTFFWGEEWSWNLFDCLVVGSDIAQTVLESMTINLTGLNNLTVMRTLRILRISRAMRILRLIRLCRELRMMVFSILRSGPALLWSCTLLGIFIYIFAVYFIQVVSYHVHSSRLLGTEIDDLPLLEEMFGTLVKAEYTLYQAVSGGISWGEISKLLLGIHGLHATIFCFFTFFTTFALLNIITGIFVETSINSAKSSQEEVAQEQMHATECLREEMMRFFQNADSDRSGSITLEEFESYLNRKEVRAYLDAIGIEIDKAKGLFQLLDIDGSGEITIEEFTFGCMRLKGGAKSIDLATLMNHTRRMSDQLRRFYSWADQQFKGLHAFESRMENCLSFLRFDEEFDDAGRYSHKISARSGSPQDTNFH